MLAHSVQLTKQACFCSPYCSLPLLNSTLSVLIS
uniref:Uncharacterized protein n=1 Tax=Anguilla anguilla TaxID=7936 RepID=A0A0E9PJ40_ANGAN